MSRPLHYISNDTAMQDLKQLLETNPDVNVTISLKQLMDGGRALIEEVYDRVSRESSEKETETYCRYQKACEILDISPATLWRWEKKGLLHPCYVGGQKRYMMSELRALLESRND